jgi:hypothetical protein
LDKYEEAENKGMFQKKHLDKVLSQYSDNPKEDISEDIYGEVFSREATKPKNKKIFALSSLPMTMRRKLLRSQWLSQALLITRD